MSYYIPPSRVDPNTVIPGVTPGATPPTRIDPTTVIPGVMPNPSPGGPGPGLPVIPPPGYIAPTYGYGTQHFAGGFGFDDAMRLARGQDIRTMLTPGYMPPPTYPLPPTRIDPTTILPGHPDPTPPTRIDPNTVIPGVTPNPTPGGPRPNPGVPSPRGLPAGALGNFSYGLPGSTAPPPAAAPVATAPEAEGDTGGSPGTDVAVSPHPTVAFTNGAAREAAYNAAAQRPAPLPVAPPATPSAAQRPIAPPVSVPLQQRAALATPQPVAATASSTPILPNASVGGSP